MKTCGLDVHKDMIFCAIYDGKDAVVNKYDTFTPDLEVMCDFILSQGVGTVAMESTGIYISAVRTVLRRRGMRAVVVNPYLIKQIGSEPPVEVWKGRKSAKKAIIAVARKLLTTIYAMLKNREQYCSQKTGRAMTASQLEKLFKLRARQYDKLRLQAREAGVPADKLSEIIQS